MSSSETQKTRVRGFIEVSDRTRLLKPLDRASDTNVWWSRRVQTRVPPEAGTNSIIEAETGRRCRWQSDSAPSVLHATAQPGRRRDTTQRGHGYIGDGSRRWCKEEDEARGKEMQMHVRRM